jgi:hypothetical protein
MKAKLTFPALLAIAIALSTADSFAQATKPTAVALSSVVAANPGLRVSVSVDFNEAVFRMGYGSLQAIERLKNNGIEVVNSPGLRAAVLVVDNTGWVFTPTALYLEQEPQSEETPNAIRLTWGHPHQILLHRVTKVQLLLNTHARTSNPV